MVTVVLFGHIHWEGSIADPAVISCLPRIATANLGNAGGHRKQQQRPGTVDTWSRPTHAGTCSPWPSYCGSHHRWPQSERDRQNNLPMADNITVIVQKVEVPSELPSYGWQHHRHSAENGRTVRTTLPGLSISTSLQRKWWWFYPAMTLFTDNYS